MDLDAFKHAVQEKRVEWQRHALERSLERDISRQEVLSALLSGEQIEDYPDATPFPSALFFRFTGDTPLHVVAAYDQANERAFVITAYRPDLEYFEQNFKTRRKS